MQSMNPIVLIFYSFLLTFLIFATTQFTRLRTLYNQTKNAKREVTMTNILSVGLSLGFFLSMKYLDPAIATAVIFGIGPGVMLLARLFSNASVHSVSKTERTLSYLALLGTIFLVAGIFKGQSGLGQLSMSNAIYGTVSALACGMALAFYTGTSKKLQTRGWNPQEIMVVRYHALLLVTGLYIAYSGLDLRLTWENVISIILVTVLGNIVPSVLFEVGIGLLDPISVALTLLAKPLLTLFIQTCDTRIGFSLYSLFGVVAIAMILALLVILPKKIDHLAEAVFYRVD